MSGTTPSTAPTSASSRPLPLKAAWTYTLRDESKRIVSEFAGATQSRDNVFLGNLLVASYANGAIAGNDRVWTFYSSDHLATPRLVTDISASTLETPRNWPYGETATPTGLFQRIRFASMERDTEASRYYDHARNHDFNLGRFLSPDRAEASARTTAGLESLQTSRQSLGIDPIGLYAAPLGYRPKRKPGIPRILRASSRTPAARTTKT